MDEDGILLPHSCKLSRDCFNFSREYFNFSRKYISSLDRNPEECVSTSRTRGVSLTRRSSSYLSSLLQIKSRYFWKLSAIHRLIRLVLTSLSCCESSLSEDIGRCDFLLLQVVHMTSVSRLQWILARHAILMAPRGTFLQTSRVLFSILSTENQINL